MHFYGLIIAISILIYYRLTHREWIMFGLDKSQFSSIFISVIIVSLIGARFYHVADKWEYYQVDLWLIPQIWLGGLGIVGALLFAFCFLLIVSAIKRLPVLLILNVYTFHLLLALGLGRIANLFSGDGFGLESIPLLILYMALIIIKRIWILSSKYQFIYFLFIYGSIRLVSDRFRTDLWYVADNLSVSTLAAALMVLGGLSLVIFTRIRLKADGQT